MKEAGYIVDDGNIVIATTLQCVHCGCHWVPQPGSKIVRGYCTRCNGPVCGKGCEECVPQEQMLDNIEKGRPLNFRPIVG